LSLIFKERSKQNIANYEPFSITDADYKILALILSIRLQRVISIINPDQVTYIKDHFIGTNVRLNVDVI
jgi:hypothetical protein